MRRRCCATSVASGTSASRLVTLGDTTGMATPATVRSLFGTMRKDFADVTPIAHFHDTRGTGLVNYVAALEAGVTHFDCAMGGVGGHPAKVKYGGGHTGNVCTEDWVGLLESMGVRHRDRSRRPARGVAMVRVGARPAAAQPRAAQRPQPARGRYIEESAQ